MHEGITSLTSKGQITIPQPIRRKMGLKPRDRVQFVIEGKTIKILPVQSKLMAGFGAVKPSQKPENWAHIREKVEKAIADEVSGH